MTTIEIIISDDEHGDTRITREVELSSKANVDARSEQERRERRMHEQVGQAQRLNDIAREVAAVAVSLHLI